MATQFIKNNTNFETMDNWNGFNGIVEKDGFKSLNLKQTNANYTELIELQEESTYTLWCEIKSMYIQQISTIKGLLFDCFFVKDDGSYEETIYDASYSFKIKSQERTLQPNKWQVIELRIQTKSLDSAKDGYTRIMFRPKFTFNEDEENGIDIYIKNISLEDTDRRYFGNNLLSMSYNLDDDFYSLYGLNNTGYRYYGGYIFETTDNVKDGIYFNFYKSVFDDKILRVGDKVRYSVFARTTSENVTDGSMKFVAKKFNKTTNQNDSGNFYSEKIGGIIDTWLKFEFNFDVTQEMIDDSSYNLLWGETGIYFDGELEDDGKIYYACPMLEIIGDNTVYNNEWIPNKNDDIYAEHIKNLIMAYGTYEKNVNIYMQRIGEIEQKEISDYVTSYTESDVSNSDSEFKLGNVGSKSVKISVRNYDDNENEIIPRDLTNYIFYAIKSFINGYDDSGNIQIKEGKFRVYENPEDFSSNMSIEMQDRMVELDVTYNTQLGLPTTIREQLDEIARLSNMLIDYSQIDGSILTETVNFYDNTYNKRDYLSWIAEKSCCNVYMDDDTIVFDKIEKSEFKEQYIDYAKQELRITDDYILKTVEYNNGIVRYIKSNDVMANDDMVYTLTNDGTQNNLSINTDVVVDMVQGKTYTFDYESNVIIFGNVIGGIFARLIGNSSSEIIEIDSLSKTFECEVSDSYTLSFYYNSVNYGDGATFSNYHLVEGEMPYNLTNKLVVNTENIYISGQSDIDRMYSNLDGLELQSCDSVSFIIGNPRIKSNDIIKLRFIDEMDSSKYNLENFMIYIFGHDLTYNKEYTSSLSCKIDSTNEEKTKSTNNVNTRIKKLSINIDQNNQSLEIIAKDQEEMKEDFSRLEIEVGGITTEVSESLETIYKFEVGSGNIFDNCQQAVVKQYPETEEKYSNNMPLGITPSFMQGKDIVISVDVSVVNGIISTDNDNTIGAEFTVAYTDGDMITYRVDWALGVYELQYILNTSTVDIDDRIWKTFKIEDKEIQSVSNLKLYIILNSEKAIISNPKVEFGTYPTGFEFDMNKIRDNIVTINENYTQINQRVDSLELKAVSTEEQIITINGDVEELTTRMQSAEIKLEPTNILLAVNEQIGADGEIYTTKFVLDKNGVHISNGGLDVSNNNGEKVLYADTSGNLTLKGTITATSGSIGGWNISSGGITKDTGTYYIGLMSSVSSSNNDVLVIRKNNNGSYTYPFYLHNDGYLYCTNAHIQGTITGSTITGTTITGGTINGTTITTDKNLYVGDNVYIGNQQSDTRKSVYMNENNYISFYNSAINLISGNSSVYVYNTTNAPTVDTGGTENGVFIQAKHPISFWAGGSEYASITIAGNAGQSGFLNEIGLSASSRIYVQTYAFVISGSNMQGFTENTSPYRNIWRPNSDGGAYLGTVSYKWNTVFAVNGSINTSDLKYKNVLQKDMKSRDFINSLKPISFTRIGQGSNGKRIHMGFGAQDVNKSIKTLGLGDLAIAQAVIVEGDQEIEYFGEEIDDSKLMWGLNYSEFIPPMVDVIQQHDKELEMLKNENLNLKSQLEVMNNKLEAVMRGDYEYKMIKN